MLRSEGDAGLGHACVELLDDFAEDLVRTVAEGDARVMRRRADVTIELSNP